jgi:hypothetical protein
MREKTRLTLRWGVGTLTMLALVLLRMSPVVNDPKCEQVLT